MSLCEEEGCKIKGFFNLVENHEIMSQLKTNSKCMGENDQVAAVALAWQQQRSKFSIFYIIFRRNAFPEQILSLKSNFWIECRRTSVAFIAFLRKCKRLIFSRSLKFCGFVAVFVGWGVLLFSFCFDFVFIHKIKLKL